MTTERQALDVAALRRLVEDERSSAETLKTAPAGSEVRREAVTTWMRSRRLLHQMLFAYAVEVVAALEEQEGLRQRVAALEIALRETDAALWDWTKGVGPIGGPVSVAELRRANALLLGPVDGAAHEAEEVERG